MEFINAVRSLGVSKKHSKHNDDLFVDRLNHRYTVAIIVLFSLVVTLSQYGGNPIHCWVPGHFTGNYANYAENICWVSSTYNVPLNEDLPNNENERKVKMLKYYQWTPFILLFQALLFYIPRMIWRSLNDKSGLDIQSIVDAVYSYNTDISKYGDKQKLINYLTNSIDHYVKSNKNTNRNLNMISEHNCSEDPEKINELSEMSSDDESYKLDYDTDTNKNKNYKKYLNYFGRFSKTLCITKGKRYGNYLLALFFFVKILYCVNSITQLFMLNHFLGNDYLLLGFEVLSKIWAGDDWTQLKRFPRVTMCDFRIREVGIVHRYTVQCVLSINLFNEKIFIFLWFWLCLISFFNLFDLISWSYSLIFDKNDTYSYIKRRFNILMSPVLNNKNSFTSQEERKLFKKFVDSYLKEDVILALRLLSRNSQDLIVSEVIASLYNLYKSQQRIVKKQNTSSIRNRLSVSNFNNKIDSVENECHS